MRAEIRVRSSACNVRWQLRFAQLCIAFQATLVKPSQSMAMLPAEVRTEAPAGRVGRGTASMCTLKTIRV